jgi:hypothetical protein
MKNGLLDGPSERVRRKVAANSTSAGRPAAAFRGIHYCSGGDRPAIMALIFARKCWRKQRGHPRRSQRARPQLAPPKGGASRPKFASRKKGQKSTTFSPRANSQAGPQLGPKGPPPPPPKNSAHPKYASQKKGRFSTTFSPPANFSPEIQSQKFSPGTTFPSQGRNIPIPGD